MEKLSPELGVTDPASGNIVSKVSYHDWPLIYDKGPIAHSQPLWFPLNNSRNFNLILKMKSGSENQLSLFVISTVPYKYFAEEANESAIIILDFGLELINPINIINTNKEPLIFKDLANSFLKLINLIKNFILH